MPLIRSSVTCIKLEHGGRTYHVALVSDGPKSSDDFLNATDPSAPVTCWYACMHSIISIHTLQNTWRLGLISISHVCMWLTVDGLLWGTWFQSSHLDPFVVWAHVDVLILTYTTDVTVMLMAWRWNMAHLTGFDPVLLDWQSALGANLRHTENSQASLDKNTHYLVMQPLGLDTEPSPQRLNLILGSDVSAAPSVCLWGRVCISPGSPSVHCCGFQAISLIALMLFFI